MQFYIIEANLGVYPSMKPYPISSLEDLEEFLVSRGFEFFKKLPFYSEKFSKALEKRLNAEENGCEYLVLVPED